MEFPTKILPTAGINTCRQRRKQCKHQLKTGCRETMNIEHSLLTESKERREEGVTLYYLDLDLEIVATKWKLTAVSIGKRGSRASGCLQCEDGRSGFWAPPSLQSATSASFTGHRFLILLSDCHLLISAPLQLKVEKSRRNQILILSYSRSSASSIDR